MKIIHAYPYLELSSSAKVEVESGALVYASAMLLQGVQGNNGCPSHLMQKFHDDFRNEYMSGLFDRTGKLNLPKEATVESDSKN